MTQSCLQVRQCRCSGPTVPPSRAAVPQGEFDKSLSICFDRPIHPGDGVLLLEKVYITPLIIQGGPLHPQNYKTGFFTS